MSKITTVEFSLSETSLRYLQELAKMQNISETAALRKALANNRFFLDEVKNGGIVIVEKKDGTRQQVFI
jgi:hypothetical protein